MGIPRTDLVNLDVTIAEFIIPRLIAFRDTDESHPGDLDSIEGWRAELTSMIRAWLDVAAAVENGEHKYTEGTRDGLRLFTDRLGYLWL